MKRRVMLMIAVLAFAGAINAQTKSTDNTVKLDEGRAGESASAADMAWLAGSWRLGDGLGGVSEEIWSRPSGGVMMGVYRSIKGGNPNFYEMMLLIETEGTLVLRLKHFTPAFVGWEEKDKSLDFKFVKKDGSRMYFSGLTFERKGAKDLTIFLALRLKDGTVREEVFTMKRVD